MAPRFLGSHARDSLYTNVHDIHWCSKVWNHKEIFQKHEGYKSISHAILRVCGPLDLCTFHYAATERGKLFEEEAKTYLFVIANF